MRWLVTNGIGERKKGMDISGNLIAAAALVALWVFEAVAPGLKGPRAGLAQRVRHMALGGVNALASAALVGVLLLVDMAASGAGFGALRWLGLPVWTSVLVGFVLLDLWQYLCHLLMHHVPVLWRLHAVHHNAETLEATAAMRFHTLEIVLIGVSTIPFVAVLGIRLETLALYHVVLVPVSMFHHADIRLGPIVDRLLRFFIVTPRMHWLHHSRWQPETDSNFGGVFSFWDRLFGTFRARKRAETVELGLDGFDEREIHTLTGMMATPFGNSRAGMGETPDEESLEPEGSLLSRRAGEKNGSETSVESGIA
jgi:sterol desaturase/sphingolipid hydroxylase (fatty acid hydroxylase superfamily)